MRASVEPPRDVRARGRVRGSSASRQALRESGTSCPHVCCCFLLPCGQSWSLEDALAALGTVPRSFDAVCLCRVPPPSFQVVTMRQQRTLGQHGGPWDTHVSHVSARDAGRLLGAQSFSGAP